MIGARWINSTLAPFPCVRSPFFASLLYVQEKVKPRRWKERHSCSPCNAMAKPFSKRSTNNGIIRNIMRYQDEDRRHRALLKTPRSEHVKVFYQVPELAPKNDRTRQSLNAIHLFKLNNLLSGHLVSPSVNTHPRNQVDTMELFLISFRSFLPK